MEGTAREINRINYLINNILYFFKIIRACGVGSGFNDVAATSKVEIRRGPFAVSPQPNGSNLEL